MSDETFSTPTPDDSRNSASSLESSIVESGALPLPRESTPQKPASWNGWDAWVMFAVAIAGSIFVSTLCTIGYLLLESSFHWAPKNKTQLGENPYFVLMVQFLLYVLLFAFLFLLITRKYRLPFMDSLGLRRLSSDQVQRFVLIGLGLALLVMGAARLFHSNQPTPLEKIFGEGRAIYFLGLFGILIAPFTEEMIFRGFLYPVFENLGGRKVAVVTTALIFSGMHVPQLWGSWAAVGLIFLVGLVFSLIRARTGLLTPCWIAHVTYNSTLILAAITAQEFSRFSPSLR